LHNGNIVKIAGKHSYYDKFSDILSLNRGVHEPLEEFAFQQVLCQLESRDNSPIRMLELGAYWGHYSMWLKSEIPNSECFLVEPSKANIECGRYNFLMNGHKGHFIQAFVGESGFRVDSFLKERNIAKLAILHCDIQGFEDQMLAGATLALQKHRIEYVFLSTHSDGLHNHCLEQLIGHGYLIAANANVSKETTACDGFILAVDPALAKQIPMPQCFLGRDQLAFSSPGALIQYISSFSGYIESRA